MEIRVSHQKEDAAHQDLRAKQLKEYDGTKDPTLHVTTFERAMYFQGVNEAIVC